MAAAPRSRLPRRAILFGAGGVLLAAFAAASGWYAWRRPTELAGIGGPFTLIDGRGRTVTDRDLLGRSALIYFGYTFCPDVCPTTLSTLATALDTLGPDAARVRPVFITIDPQRDTPAVVRDYVAAFSPQLLGLTGSTEAIASVARAYRVYYAPHRTGDGPGDYTMDHSSILYLMDPQGALRALIRTDQTAPEMAAEIRRNL